MIEASELRIGNWIKNGIGEDFKANAQTICYFYESQSTLGAFSPIPLTEEWLERFGLTKKIMPDSTPHYTNDNVDFEPGVSPDGKGGFMYCILVDSSTETWQYITHVQYVHQLQNLYFALTGEELELK